MTSKFTVTVEHDDTVTPAEVEQLLEHATSEYTGMWKDFDTGEITKVIVEPQ